MEGGIKESGNGRSKGTSQIEGGRRGGSREELVEGGRWRKEEGRR